MMRLCVPLKPFIMQDLATFCWFYLQEYPPRVLNAPHEVWLVISGMEFSIGTRGSECIYDGATRWSKKF